MNIHPDAARLGLKLPNDTLTEQRRPSSDGSVLEQSHAQQSVLRTEASAPAGAASTTPVDATEALLMLDVWRDVPEAQRRLPASTEMPTIDSALSSADKVDQLTAYLLASYGSPSVF